MTIVAASKPVALAAEAPASDARINILGAWYGDVNVIRRAQRRSLDPWKDNDRFCSATGAIRARCQGRVACYQAAAPQGGGNESAGATADLNGASLCGYEPAPFANPRDKGVIVSYECIARTPDFWKSIGFGDPAKLDTAHSALDAQLRTGALGEIRCQGFYQ